LLRGGEVCSIRRNELAVYLIIPVMPAMLIAAYTAAPAVTASTGVARAGEQIRVATAMPIVSVFISNLVF
jgi:hypothetical protein